MPREGSTNIQEPINSIQHISRRKETHNSIYSAKAGNDLTKPQPHPIQKLSAN